MPLRSFGAVAVGQVTVALAMLFALAAGASAHTDLVSTDPVEGATLASLPEELTLTFTDRMSGEFDTVNLTVAGGELIPLETTAEGNLVRARVPTRTLAEIGAEGTVDWRLVYRVVSADGHPVEGVVGFKAPLPPPPEPSPSQSPTAEPPADPTAEEEPDQRPVTSSTGDQSSGSSSAFFVIAGIVIAATTGFVVFAVRRRAHDRASDA